MRGTVIPCSSPTAVIEVSGVAQMVFILLRVEKEAWVIVPLDVVSYQSWHQIVVYFIAFVSV